MVLTAFWAVFLSLNLEKGLASFLPALRTYAEGMFTKMSTYVIFHGMVLWSILNFPFPDAAWLREDLKKVNDLLIPDLDYSLTISVLLEHTRKDEAGGRIETYLSIPAEPVKF